MGGQALSATHSSLMIIGTGITKNTVAGVRLIEKADAAASAMLGNRNRRVIEATRRSAILKKLVVLSYI
jgi:hypothetical protein